MPLFLATAALSALLSMLAAAAADAWLGGRIALLGSVLGLEYSLNSGVAFGLQLPPVLQEVLIGTALVLVIWMAWRSSRKPAVQTAFGLIVGGGIANVIDRLYDGFVTDYVQISTFPIFNLADACVTAGVVLLLYETMGNAACGVRHS